MGGMESPSDLGMAREQFQLPPTAFGPATPSRAGDDARPRAVPYKKIEKPFLDKLAKKIRGVLFHVYPPAIFCRRVLSVISLVTKVSNAVQGAFRCLSFLSVFDALLHLKDLCGLIEQMIFESTPSKKIQALFFSIMKAASIVFSISNIAVGLQAIGAVSKAAIAWTAPLLFVKFPFLFLVTALSCKALVTAIGTHAKSIDVFPKFTGDEAPGAKEQKLTEFYTELLKRDVRELHKGFRLSKHVVLDARILTILAKLKNIETKEAGIEDGTALMKRLKQRTHSLLASQVLATSNMFLVTTAVALIVFSAPVPQLITSLFAITAVVSMAKYFHEILALEKNPFDDSQRAWPIRAYRCVKMQGIEISSKMYHIFFSQVPEPQLMREELLVRPCS